MADLVFASPHTLIGGAEVLSRALQEGTENNRGWEQVKLRHAQNDTSFDKAVDAFIAGILANVCAATGVGSTEAQQTVSPGRTGSPEAAIDAIGTSNAGVAASSQAIATSLGNLASALVPIITAAGGVVTAQTLAALLPVVVTAVGGASTPSQTQAKPTGGTTS
jgi:hypothetical protein